MLLLPSLRYKRNDEMLNITLILTGIKIKEKHIEIYHKIVAYAIGQDSNCLSPTHMTYKTEARNFTWQR